MTGAEAQAYYNEADVAHLELVTSLAMLQEMFEQCDGEISFSVNGTIGMTHILKRCRTLAEQVEPYAIVQAVQHGIRVWPSRT